MVAISDRADELTSIFIWGYWVRSTEFFHFSQSLLQMANLCFQVRNEGLMNFKLVPWYQRKVFKRFLHLGFDVFTKGAREVSG